MDLQVDKSRTHLHEMTGIYVRAKHDDKWGSYDIAELDKNSLHTFLRSRGGNNIWAENVVAILLGHGHFKENEERANL